MMANNLHKYLKNEPDRNDGFKKKRGFKKEEEEDEPIPKVITAAQKEYLRVAANRFGERRARRIAEKTLQIPGNIELVRINFFAVFNLDLQTKFWDRYGLSVLEYTHFNKTVLFEIGEERLFQTFLGHLGMVADSSDGDSYEGRPYNLIALINSFEFITDAERVGIISDKGFLISLVSSAKRVSVTQKDRLRQYLADQVGQVSYQEAYPDIIEVTNLQPSQLSALVKNFDIIRQISSTRPIRIRPGTFGEERRSYGFRVEVADDLPVIGIIDTGVSSIEPLRGVLTTVQYDHTGNGAFWDESGHGTMVAGLVVFGDTFQKEVRDSYIAKARIAVIKPIHNEDDVIDIPRLLNDISDARRSHGIRIFNMSINLNIVKPYNHSFSTFAYELDRLAFKEDILVIMSVGNYPADDLHTLLNGRFHPSHNYPQFFYDLTSTSADHSCWFTNIQEPSESLNNLSIGALAGNLEGNNNQDTTPASEYPAYYTRKYHFDPAQDVNGTPFQRNQKNKHLNKPDMVYEGGDLFSDAAGIEILRSPLTGTNRYYARSCGTSLATPLVTSLAAEILHFYPNLSTQSVKALLINNAFSPAGKKPPAFQGLPIDLYRKLCGFGKPSRNNLVLTNDDTVVWIVEDTVQYDELKVIPIEVPPFVSESGSKLHVSATLCYSFLPVKNNHLNYLPLHISFGFFKDINAATIGGSDATDYRIKSGISWSEDFHGVEKRLFANTQKMDFNIQAKDLKRLENKLSLAIRCTGKAEIPEMNKAYVEGESHKFSVVMSISEIPTGEATGRLYEELNALNEVSNIALLDGEIDIDI